MKIKNLKYPFFSALLLLSVISCEKKIENITGIGVNAIGKEYLSSKIDTNFVIKLTSNSPTNSMIKMVEFKSPYGYSWGTTDLSNGSGTIVIRRDSLEKYALKSGGNYLLTNMKEIQIPNINLISLDFLDASSVATLLIGEAVSYTLNADIISNFSHQDTIKTIGSIIQSDYPVYFRYNLKSSDIDNPNYKVNLIISLVSQNNGTKTLRSRDYSMISDTIIIRGSDFNVNDKINLRIRCSTNSGLSDDISSAQFTVNAWTFQNSLTNRILKNYFNLTRGTGSDINIQSPHIKYNGGGSVSLVSNNDTTVSAVKFTGYKFDSRLVNDVKNKYNAGVSGTTFTVAPNDALGIRYAYKNSKGIQEYSWAVVFINSIGDPVTLEDNIIFGYQYKPQTY